MRSGNDTSVRPALAWAAVLGLVALAACHRQADPSAPATRPGTAASKPAADAGPTAEVADANRKMAAGVPVGMSTAPVEVRFDLANAPVAGQPFSVNVAVLPEAPAPVLHIDIRGGEGLQVLAPVEPVSIEKVQAGTLARLEVKAQANAPGTRVLSIRVTLELPTGTETRDFAFPLIVIPPPGKGAG